jgi:hypothetical protein
MRLAGALAATLVAGVACCGLRAADTPPEQALRDHVPKPGEFPPAGAGVQMAGDLVVIDPMNRRCSLRFDGGHQSIGRLPVALLPYGMCWYHGAPAELRDIPPGTHVHVRLLLPPEDEQELVPRTDKLRHTHVLELEDDFSFYARRGRAWKVVAVEPGSGLSSHRFELVVDPEGPAIDGGINKQVRFLLDPETRIWKDRRLVAREAIEPGQIVQVNLTWSTPWQGVEYGVTDVWLDEESRKAFTEIQRQRHLRHQRSRWLPGWVDAVENYDRGGGTVTLTFFGGMDPVLYEELEGYKDAYERPDKGLRLCDAENTLRAWTQYSDYGPAGRVLSWTKAENPPPGSSGIQVTMEFDHMLDGFRPGRVVRMKGPWPYVHLPKDEWLNTVEDLERASRLTLP